MANSTLPEHHVTRVKVAGWNVCEVPRIPPPEEKEDLVHPHFRDQYTKIAIWSWEVYDAVVYLDADCLVTGDLSELFTLSTPFAGVHDWMAGRFQQHMNFGAFTLQPSLRKFRYLMEMRVSFVDYEPVQEQQFFYAIKEPWTALPPGYNANLAIFQQNPGLWAAMVSRDEIRVIHYTVSKPFSRNDSPHKDILAYPLEYWKFQYHEYKRSLEVRTVEL